MPEERQNILWSATIPTWVRSIADNFLSKNTIFIDLVGKNGNHKGLRIPETVEHFGITIQRDSKLSILSKIIEYYSRGGRTLVFTETKRNTVNIAQSEALNGDAVALNGDMSQGSREQALDLFRRGDVSVLVATDIAARGLGNRITRTLLLQQFKIQMVYSFNTIFI